MSDAGCAIGRPINGDVTAEHAVDARVRIVGLQSRPDYNDKVGRVTQALHVDRGRYGVNVMGEDVWLRPSNLEPIGFEHNVLATFRPSRKRPDLDKALGALSMQDGTVYVYMRREVVEVGAEPAQWAPLIRPVPWNEPNRALVNLLKSYGAPVIPALTHRGPYLADLDVDMRDLSVLGEQDLERLQTAATVEHGAAQLLEDELEVPMPWAQAWKHAILAYKAVVDDEPGDTLETMAALYRAAGRRPLEEARAIETVAHWFADGRIPRYYYGLPFLMMRQPAVSDLKLCELRSSPIGGQGGLGVFVGRGVPRGTIKAGCVLTLYPSRMLGQYWNPTLEGAGAVRDHHTVCQMHDAPVWQAIAEAGDQDTLMTLARRYSVTMAPAPGCALFSSSPPTPREGHDPAWIGHMANSTRDGTPVANATLVPNLFGGTLYAVAAIADIEPGEEVVVDYGDDWFASHPDVDIRIA